MGNIFDRLKQNAYKVVDRTMGYDAEWRGVPFRILFNRPTGQDYLGNDSDSNAIVSYILMHPWAEYFEDECPGLYEAVDQAGFVAEKIRIKYPVFNVDTWIEFHIKVAIKKYDGDYVRLELYPVEQNGSMGGLNNKL